MGKPFFCTQIFKNRVSKGTINYIYISGGQWLILEKVLSKFLQHFLMGCSIDGILSWYNFYYNRFILSDLFYIKKLYKMIKNL